VKSGANDVNAVFMSLELHDRGIHAISAGGNHIPPVTAAWPKHENITGTAWEDTIGYETVTGR
jgi:hypothetical protein